MTQSGERDAIVINYSAREPARPRYYANDHSRDTVIVEQHVMAAHDGRAARTDLDDAGFMLVDHKSAVSDFADRDNAARVHCPEIAELVQRVTGAVPVIATTRCGSSIHIPLMSGSKPYCGCSSAGMPRCGTAGTTVAKQENR